MTGGEIIEYKGKEMYLMHSPEDLSHLLQTSEDDAKCIHIAGIQAKITKAAFIRNGQIIMNSKSWAKKHGGWHKKYIKATNYEYVKSGKAGSKNPVEEAGLYLGYKFGESAESHTAGVISYHFLTNLTTIDDFLREEEVSPYKIKDLIGRNIDVYFKEINYATFLNLESIGFSIPEKKIGVKS